MNKKVQTQEETARNLSFSVRLAAAMSAAGFNKSSLGRAISSSHTSVGRWLDGGVPKADVLNEIAHQLNVSAYWLLTGEGEMSTTREQSASHPSSVAEKVGAFDQEEQVLNEIRVRIQQFKHSEKNRRDLYSQQIQNRVQEYSDWCETFGKPIRDSQLPYARQQTQSPKS